jgi:triosephosphate isomerase
MRHPLVMGNWKLNGSRHVVNELVANLRKELAGVTAVQLLSLRRICTWIWLNTRLTAATSPGRAER